MMHAARRDALHLAALQDNSSLVRKLLAGGHRLGTRDSQGNTALHAAAAHGAAGALRALLQEAAKAASASEDIPCHARARSLPGGAALSKSQPTHGCSDNAVHVDSTNLLGWTPLMQAARYGRGRALDLLLEFGACVNVLNCLETNVLALAAASGDVASVRSLIRAGASATAGQMSAVVVAAQRGEEAVLRLLLDRGASPNSPVLDTGVTPLMAAALCPSLACVELLLARGADPNLLSAAGTPAIQFAAMSGDAQPVYELLLKYTSSVSRVLPDATPSAVTAVCLGDLRALHAILAQDPDQAKAANSDGVTALMAAAVLGLEQVALLLLQLEADPNTVERINGWSPLMLALYNGHANVAQLLLRYGADLGHVSPKGHTVFDFAAQISNLEIMRAYVRAVCKADATLPAPDCEVQSASHNHGIKKWISKMSDRLQRARTEKDLSNMIGCQTSSLDDHITLPPVPPIVGQPILPDLPHRPPQLLPPSFCYEEDDFFSRSLRLSIPFSNAVDTSLRWDSIILGAAAGRAVNPGGQARRRGSTQRLVNRINRERARASESESSVVGSSDSASTGTTVQTRRDARRHRGRKDTDNRSAAEELTMSLGARKVSEVLQKLALHHHTAQFEQEDVDFEAFLELTPEDIKELGVTDQQSQLKILRAIQSLSSKMRRHTL